MKKSMAGQGAAGALLLAGLMMSAGAMAASGDPVQGGSGSVTINVPIVTSTCSVSVPTEVSFDPIDRSNLSTLPGHVIAAKTFDIRFTNCQGRAIQMTAQSQADNGASIGDLLQGGFSTGDDNRALEYIIEIPSITGVTGGINKIFSLRSNNPVL
ncbi:hypothetical protein P4X47_003806 [Salmonella enterica]|nr:hypothetical protein [Salmonella enterica]EGA4263251.1 hypothetical protein [Salmonella enterica]EGJ0542666.1 hypothetical protein [Salmonella enterica]EGL9187601.1 hypothetical protein [Salmonella enterica]EGN1232407.1 hypothetical protein [Salmonella enterica]